MHLSPIQPLTKTYTQTDIAELVSVTQSTRLSSPSAILRYGKIPPSELRDWLRESCTHDLEREFRTARISSMKTDSGNGKPSLLSHLAERLVVRDLDMVRLDPDLDLGTDLERESRADGSDVCSNGRIVAYADYRFTPSYGTSSSATPWSSGDSRGTNDSKRDRNTATTSSPAISPPAGFNAPLHSTITTSVSNKMESLFHSLPCFELHSISTLSPSHLRQGIGTQLTKWIFPYADFLGVPVVLSASPVGLALYRRCGFVEVGGGEVVVRLGEWGGEGEHRLVTMVRWPVGRREGSGCLEEGWRWWIDVHERRDGD